MEQLVLMCAVAAVAAAIFLFIGGLLVRGLGLPAAPPLFGLFLRLVLGLSAVLVAYAGCRTGGGSVLLGLLLTLGGLAWRLRQPPLGLGELAAGPVALGPGTAAGASGGSPLALLAVAAVLVTAFRFTLIYNFSSGHYDTPYPDWVYYARLAFPLNVQGIETNMLEPTALIRPIPQPYHYYDLWLNALMEWATGIAPAVTITVLTYSLLLTVVYFGYCALFEHFGQPRGRALLLGGTCLFFVGVFLPFFSKSTFLMNTRYSLLSYFPIFSKLAPVHLFLLLGFLLYVQGRRAAAFWAWASVPLVFISTAPAVLSALGLLGLGIIFRTKARPAGWGQWLLPPVAVGAFIGGFYLLSARLHPQAASPYFTGSGMLAMVVRPDEWRTALHVMAGAVLAFAAYYFLFGGLVLALALPHPRRAWAQVRPYAGLLALVGGVCGSGLLMWGLGLHLLDAWQFFNNAGLPAVAVLFATLVAVLLRRRGARAAYGVAASLALVLVVNLRSTDWQWPIYMRLSQSPEFLDEVKQCAPRLGPVGGAVLGPNEYFEGPTSYNTYTHGPGLYLTTLRGGLLLLNLSHLSLDPIAAAQTAPVYGAIIRQAIEQTPIRLFAHQRRAQNPTLTDAEVQREFVLSQGISFVCVSPAGVLPASLRPLVSQTLEDAATHDKLYLLRTAPNGGKAK